MKAQKILPGMGVLVLVGLFLLTGCYTHPKGFHEIFAKKEVTHIGVIEHAPASSGAFLNYHFLGNGWAYSRDMFSPYWDESFYGMSNYYYMLSMGYLGPYSFYGYGFSPYGWYNSYLGWYNPNDFFDFQALNGEKIVFNAPVWGASPNRRSQNEIAPKSRIRKRSHTSVSTMAIDDYIHPEVKWETISVGPRTVRDALPNKKGELPIRVKPMKVFINDVIPDFKTPPLVPRNPLFYRQTRTTRESSSLFDSPPTGSTFSDYSRGMTRRSGFSSFSRSRSPSHSSSARVRKNEKR